MTFTPEIWKERVSERLDRIGDVLKKRGWKEAPHLVYGGLRGMTLWPLVEAAQSGLLMPAALALGSIAGGVGGNLIATRLERWKERANEADVHEWVAKNAPNNPDLRDALDAIIENFDVLARAEAGLDEEDRAWFLKALGKGKRSEHVETKIPDLPLGITNFEKIITQNYYYIDKTSRTPMRHPWKR